MENLWQRLSTNASCFSALRKKRFDCVIQASRSTPRDHRLFGRLLGAQRYLTRAFDPTNGHEIVRTLSILNGVGLNVAPTPPCVFPDPEGVARARALLKCGPVRPALTAIHLSGRTPERQWPLENYLNFIKWGVRQGGRFVVLWSPGDRQQPGHPGDDERAARLREELTGLPVTFFPTETISHLISALRACSNLIACDGGQCHLAAALQLPVLGLYCRDKVEDWRPWGNMHRIVSAVTVPQITVESVCQAFLTLPQAPGS